MVAEQYERVIKLAQRAMELERELEQVRRELASSGVAPAKAKGSIEFDDEDIPEARVDDDEEFGASLAKQVLALYKTHSPRSLTSEQIAKALGITDPTRINMLRSYAVRFSQGAKPKLRKTKRGHYQYAGK